MFDDGSIGCYFSSKQVSPHSDDIPDILIGGLAGDGGVILSCFEKVFLINLHGLA